ncbi:MAG: FHA domain-containing protein, partial [Thermoguttaceae bacterium]|nr:FHA domain-containing protein [Thermoguttaceae bacterium]
MDSLFVIQGNDQGRRYTLDDSTITIGRDSSNRIRLHDPEASRRHAEIRINDLGRTIVDLESSNGLFVNGKQIQSRRLANGDQIQIGKTVLLFASRTLDVGAQEPLVDVFQESEQESKSRVIHTLTPEESRRL